MTHDKPFKRTRGPVSDEIKVQRKLERRSQLIGAAIQVYGELGYRHASVRLVCERAGLTQRYFYESFAHSDELLIACYQQVSRELQGEILLAANAAGREPKRRARAVLDAYFSALRRMPQAANVFLVDIRGISPQVDRAIDDSLSVTGQEIANAVFRREVEVDAMLLAGVMGGIIHIALRWVTSGYQPEVGSVVDAAFRLSSLILQE